MDRMTYSGSVRIRFICCRHGPVGSFCEHGNESQLTKKKRANNFLINRNTINFTTRALLHAVRPVTGFNNRPGHVGFVVDKAALGQVFFPEYFGFLLSVSLHQCSVLTHSSPPLYNVGNWQRRSIIHTHTLTPGD
jgi:hypothetical protein